MRHLRVIEIQDTAKERMREKVLRRYAPSCSIYHTQEPCISASHALLLCNVARKRARSAQVESGLGTMAAAVFVIEDSTTTPRSSPCGCGAWSSGSGGVVSLGDGVGDGDNDSGGVEPAECYAHQYKKEHVLVI